MSIEASEILPQKKEMGNLDFALAAHNQAVFKDANPLRKVVRKIHGRMIRKALNQPPVLDVVGQYRGIDEEEAERISSILGVIAYNLALRTISMEDIEETVASVAEIVKLGGGGRRSGEAIATAMAIYVLSGNSFRQDDVLKDYVCHMGEAITEDPIRPWETADLGMSQAIRLLGFVRKIQKAQDTRQPGAFATDQRREAFVGLPTIGAEFHIPEDQKVNDTFWQRLAILNMSQYQRGSDIPFSKTTSGLIEIRMNPSVYPVATSTWNLMRLLLPELNRAYFTMAINRRDKDFNPKDDKNVIMFLHALGNLLYAASFNNIPQVETPEQINFGGYYLGQTVRVRDRESILTGRWRGGYRPRGQLNICTGYGDLFEGLAFYLSMGLTEPAMLEKNVLGYDIREATSLKDALEFKPDDIRDIFERLNGFIVNNPGLSSAVEHEQRIIEEFRP